MPITKTILGAEISLDLELDPAVTEWKQSARADGSHSETYTGSGYLLNLVTETRPLGTIVIFKVSRKDGRDFTIKRYTVTANSKMNDVHRLWIPYNLSPYFEPTILIRSWPWFGGGALPYAPQSSADRRIPIVLGLNRLGDVTLGLGFIDQRIETGMESRAATHHSTGELDRAKMVMTLTRPIDGYTLGPLSEHRDGFFVAKGRFWFDTLRDYATVHAEKMNRPVKPSPDTSWDPLLAPWVFPRGKWANARIEDVDEDLLLKAMKIAVKLGIKSTINMGSWFDSPPPTWKKTNQIVWSFPDRIGYYCPDPKKFPDFKAFNGKLHRIGVRNCIWISPFVVGKGTKTRETMGKYAVELGEPPEMELPILTHRAQFDNRGQESREVADSYLCPRNPTVQKYVADLMARCLRDYDADGYTVDMVDTVPLDRCEANHEHNFSSIGLATDYCFAKMKEAMDAVNPDAVIEFRQKYANINMLDRATAFRATDSGDTRDYELNRKLCVELRSYVPPGVAVHTDPMWWSIDEDDVVVSKMMSTMVTSGVPQLAPDLINLPQSHLKLIKNWLSFYHEHKSDFRWGQMRPIQNDTQFSTITITNGEKAFVSYGNYPALRVPLSKSAKEIYLFNCGLGDSLYTILQGIFGGYSAEMYDHTFTSVGTVGVEAKQREALVDLNVPQGGYAVLKAT